jgi:ADP-ribose pyrophosphatase
MSKRQVLPIDPGDFPRIGARTVVFDSPWVRVVTKDVTTEPDAKPEHYHVVESVDWTAVCPRTADGRYLLIRQYRPTVEARVWEFPGGAIDAGESPAAAIARELVEETGHGALKLVSLGGFFTDYGRLSSRGHMFFAEVEAIENAVPELGIEVGTFTIAEIDRLFDGDMTSFPQLTLWMMVKAAGYVR